MGYMSDDTYKVTIQCRPASVSDAAPWFTDVQQGSRYVGSGWSGTREEALRRAQEIIDADQRAGEIEVLTMRPSA